jgi:hypothetical protein
LIDLLSMPLYGSYVTFFTAVESFRITRFLHASEIVLHLDFLVFYSY